MGIYNFISLLGLFLILGVAWILSTDRKNMNWRLIGLGVTLQLLIGLMIFVFPAGTRVFWFINDKVISFIHAAAEGVRFLFGRLALQPGDTGLAGEESLGFILAFQALPTIIFFSAFLSILYYLRIMPLIVKGFAIVFSRLFRISGAESLVAASNLFVGVESALTARPYLKNMTRSELMTVITVGLATVASNVLVLYIFMLERSFPSIAGHLVSASLLSAPAALVLSKIMVPESQSPETLGTDVDPYYENDNSFFEAIINGSNSGVKLIVGIVALLISVLGLVSVLDLILAWIGAQFSFDISLGMIAGLLFYPFILITGIPLADVSLAAQIIGERIILTEVASYGALSAAIVAEEFSSPRSPVIIVYALCGFAHFASLAIFVGGVAAIAPERTGTLASIGMRALIAANLACLMTACVAGFFLTGQAETILFR